MGSRLSCGPQAVAREAAWSPSMAGVGGAGEATIGPDLASAKLLAAMIRRQGACKLVDLHGGGFTLVYSPSLKQDVLSCLAHSVA